MFPAGGQAPAAIATFYRRPQRAGPPRRLKCRIFEGRLELWRTALNCQKHVARVRRTVCPVCWPPLRMPRLSSRRNECQTTRAGDYGARAAAPSAPRGLGTAGARHPHRAPPLGEGLTRVVVESVLICGCPLGDLWIKVVVCLRLRLGGATNGRGLTGVRCVSPPGGAE